MVMSNGDGVRIGLKIVNESVTGPVSVNVLRAVMSLNE